jgi:hypothetical protein
VHLVALGSLSNSGFLVILGDCRHLASLLVAEIVEHHLVVVWGSDHWLL